VTTEKTPQANPKINLPVIKYGNVPCKVMPIPIAETIVDRIQQFLLPRPNNFPESAHPNVKPKMIMLPNNPWRLLCSADVSQPNLRLKQ